MDTETLKASVICEIDAHCHQLSELSLKTQYNPHQTFGSTDMGNVSQIVPSVHPFAAIAPVGVTQPSTEFTLAAALETGIQGCLMLPRL